MSKKVRKELCAYCRERPAVTGDHIFAREFVLVAERADLPQAPICEQCNNEKSKLEHYLTAVLPFGGRHSSSPENLASMVPKRLGRNVKLHRQLPNGQEDIPPGATGEHGDAMAIPLDGDKLEQLFGMIAKGLIWYHHWHFCLNKDYSVKVHSVTKAGEAVFDQLLFRRNVRDRVQGNPGNGTFTYRRHGFFHRSNHDLRVFSIASS